MELHIGQHYMANLFGFDVHMDTLITLWLAMGLILLFAILSVSKIGIVPTKIQAIFEKIISPFKFSTSFFNSVISSLKSSFNLYSIDVSALK